MTDTPATTTPAHQRRILAKLETLWAAQPNACYCDIITQVYTLTNELWVGDDEIERALDEALDAAGLTVAGGWKS